MATFIHYSFLCPTQLWMKYIPSPEFGLNCAKRANAMKMKINRIFFFWGGGLFVSVLFQRIVFKNYGCRWTTWKAGIQPLCTYNTGNFLHFTLISPVLNIENIEIFGRSLSQGNSLVIKFIEHQNYMSP